MRISKVIFSLKYTLVAAALGLILGAEFCVAADGTSRSSNFGIENKIRKGLELGYAYGYFTYAEEGMRDTGSLQGLKINYEKQFESSEFAFRLESDFMFGVLKYDGALIDKKTFKSTPHTTETFDYVLNARALGALNFETGLSPFVGFGVRYINDNMAGIGSYEREITYTYLPIGLSMKFQVSNRWALAFTGEYDRFLTGTVKSHMTQVGFSRDLENRQSNGSGYRVSLDISGTLNRRYDLHFGPYYQHWQISDSDIQIVDKNGFHEPENTTDLIGFGLSIGL